MSKKGIDMVAPFLLDIDFNLEDLEDNTLADDWDRLQLLEIPSQDILAGLPSGFGGKLCDDDSGPHGILSEYEEKPKLKNLSQGNGDATSDRDVLFGDVKDSKIFQTTSGSVSVFESGSSLSTDNSRVDRSVHFGFRFIIPVKRARSKRLRPPTLNPRLTAISFISCSEKRKGKRKNLSILSGGGNDNNESTLLSNGTRKCSHCEVTKTPQWREGPMGPKTLCNACGVRYRSGRLFPEYRPAASPTFVAAVHSNSHKKVIEMRRKATREGEVEIRPLTTKHQVEIRPPNHQLEDSNGYLCV